MKTKMDVYESYAKENGVSIRTAQRRLNDLANDGTGSLANANLDNDNSVDAKSDAKLDNAVLRAQDGTPFNDDTMVFLADGSKVRFAEVGRDRFGHPNPWHRVDPTNPRNRDNGGVYVAPR